MDEFFSANQLDETKNYFMFYNHIEQELFYDSQFFDENYVLFLENKNYFYLYYLYGFCHENVGNNKKAIECYLNALEFNPFSISVNISLINLYLKENILIDYDMLVFLESICFDIKDLKRIYIAFAANLRHENMEDESDIIQLFITDIEFGSLDKINLNVFNIFNKYNFNVRFNERIISIIEDTKLKFSKDSDEYKYYHKLFTNMMEFNIKMDELKGNKVENISESRLIKDFSDDELLDSYVLIKDFENKNIVCYSYRQITGTIFFVYLATAEIGNDLKINPRKDLYDDILYPKELMDEKEGFILDDLTQFRDYLDLSNDYSRFIKFNLSKNKELDKKFLINELINLSDDDFGFKRDAIGDELRKIINIKEFASKNIPCNEIIKKVNECRDCEKSLAIIDEFLEKYPPLYFNSFIEKYFYFNSEEYELYMKYYQPSENITLIPEKHNYCEIFNLKGKCLINLGKIDGAKQAIVNSLSFNPFNVNAHIILSELYEKKDINLAISLLKEALLYNTDINRHSEIYEKLSTLTSDEKLSKDLKSLSFLIKNYDRDSILEIKDNIINNHILLGFNTDLVENDEFYLGTNISKILQQTNPLLEKHPQVASKKLNDFLYELSDSNKYGYEIPFNKFDTPLFFPEDEKTSNDKFYNFKNNMEEAIFNELYSREKRSIIPPEDDYVQLLNNYGCSLIQLEQAKSKAIFEETLKLNPVNTQTLLSLIDLNKRTYNMNECKIYIDKIFKVCYEKNTLIKAYEELYNYYRLQGLTDILELLEEFIKNLKSNTFKEEKTGEYKKVFSRYNIQIGFNEKIEEIAKNIDIEYYNKIKEVNDAF